MEQRRHNDLALCQDKSRCEIPNQPNHPNWTNNPPVYCTRPYRSVAFKTWTVGSAKALYADRRPRLSSVGCSQPYEMNDTWEGRLLPTARRCHSSSAVVFHSCPPCDIPYHVTPTWDQYQALSTSASASSMRLPRRQIRQDVQLDRSNSYHWDARIKLGSPTCRQKDCRPTQQKKTCWNWLMTTVQKIHPKAQKVFFPNSVATIRPSLPSSSPHSRSLSAQGASRDRSCPAMSSAGSLGKDNLRLESFATKKSEIAIDLYQLELLKEQMACVRRNDLILIDRLHQLEGKIGLCSLDRQKTRDCPCDSQQRTYFTIPRCLRGEVRSFDT
uniref:Uncharacterized protein n=1 Tax=Trichuris muris TaxID=70415 RepID=A0A5S6Q8X6_TRIMR